jgi:hypothetical protein
MNVLPGSSVFGRCMNWYRGTLQCSSEVSGLVDKANQPLLCESAMVFDRLAYQASVVPSSAFCDRNLHAANKTEESS